MNILGPPSIQKTGMALAAAIKQTIDTSTDMTDEEKDKAKKKVDETKYVATEVPNTLVYWLAVGGVGLIALIIAIGALYLSGIGKEIPNFLQTTLATAIGALAGMIVPTPKTGL